MSCPGCFTVAIGFFVASALFVFLAFWFSRFRWLSVVFAVLFVFAGAGFASMVGHPGISCEQEVDGAICVDESVGCADGWVMHGVAACSSPEAICCIPRSAS